jgi:hypothetical protein
MALRKDYWRHRGAPKAEPEEISRKLLKACARHLLDFSVMDRSSEQSVCNLARLQEK